MGINPDDQTRYNYRNFIELERGRSTRDGSSSHATKDKEESGSWEHTSDHKVISVIASNEVSEAL